MQASLTKRLLSRRAAAMLGRNTVVSTAVFAFDLLLLWLLVSYAGMGRLLGATLAFVVASTAHYALGRVWIFRGSKRGVAPGYIYFLINQGVGLIITLALFALLMDVLGLDLIAARIVASIFAGLTVFVLNAVLNFRSV